MLATYLCFMSYFFLLLESGLTSGEFSNCHNLGVPPLTGYILRLMRRGCFADCTMMPGRTLRTAGFSYTVQNNDVTLRSNGYINGVPGILASRGHGQMHCSKLILHSTNLLRRLDHTIKLIVELYQLSAQGYPELVWGTEHGWPSHLPELSLNVTQGATDLLLAPMPREHYLRLQMVSDSGPLNLSTIISLTGGKDEHAPLLFATFHSSLQ